MACTINMLGFSFRNGTGVGRLPLLVPDELRLRFETQKERLAAAVRSEKEKFVTTQADGMRRA